VAAAQMVHWVATAQIKRLHASTQAAAGTCHTHLASYSDGVQQQERAYYPNNNTRVRTQGLSQSSSALLPPLCVLNFLI